MLIEFSVENYLSFKDLVTFSMVASSIKQHNDTHVFEAMDYKLLKSSTIYGANSSGKSNLLKAMQFSRNFIINSFKDKQAKEEIDVDNFKLSTETENEPSTFEFVFIQNNTKYRYGFKVNRKEITDEWLFQATKNKENILFERSFQDIKVSRSFKEGKGLESKTRNNALFLSVVAQFNGQITVSIIEWFLSMQINSGLNREIATSLDKNIKNDLFKEQYLKMLKIADLHIEDFKIESITNPKIKTIHKKYDENKNFASEIEFDLIKNESQGTQTLFSILNPIFDSLNNGKVLVIDEFDINLHPLITISLIKLINSNKYNPKNAQLIFTTHDTNLLNKDIFRRDQIWFTEKDNYGKSDLFSLIEYEFPEGKVVRYDRSFAKDYLSGKYGAIPFIGSFELLSIDNHTFNGKEAI